MQDEVKDYIQKGRKYMDDSIDHLSKELNKVRTGKASPSVLSGVMVDYYGTPTVLSQVANVATSDSKTITVQPWEKSLIADIERAIFEANLGLTPQNDGEVIRISIPALTEERRKDLVKQAKSLGEDTKVSLRSARHKLMDFIKKAVKDGYPEDMGKKSEGIVDKITQEYGDKIDGMISSKEKDIMTV